MSLGERIQQLRKSGGLSQEQLADMIKVSRQTISKWETDQSFPEIEKILAISKVFVISTDELLGNDVVSGNSANQLKEAVKASMKKRQFAFGWLTTVLGLFLLVLEFFSLLYLQHIERVMYNQWNNDVMSYVTKPPMPIIFLITAVIIGTGVCLIGVSLVGKKVKSR